MPTHGSCRPLVTTSTGLPATSIESRGVMIELVGLIATDTSKSCPVLMPPNTPPALLDMKPLGVWVASRPMDNQGYQFMSKLGVLDTIQLPADGSQPQFKTWIYAIKLGDAQIVTTPGELFPEVLATKESSVLSTMKEAYCGPASRTP